MSYLCELRFRPRQPLEPEFLETLGLYITSLRRNGQFLGDYVSGWEGAQLVIRCKVPTKNAMDAVYRSDYSQAWLLTLSSWCERNPICKVHNHDAGSSHVESLQSLTRLIVDPFEDSPVRVSPDGLGVPLFLLPLEAEEREHLHSWHRQFEAVSVLEAGGGCLGFESYREMADPYGWLNRLGRAWAGRLEEATGLPTYYYLYHRYGDGSEPRPCSLCGADWQNFDAEWTEFPLVCHSCRLLSEHPTDHGRDCRAAFGNRSAEALFAPHPRQEEPPDATEVEENAALSPRES